MLGARMRVSLQVHYAVCGVFDLAYNGGGARVSIQEISERQAIPMRYLEQIFQRLRRAQLVSSKRGPGGGYTLTRPPEQITLRQVVEAVEGPLEKSLRRGTGAKARSSEFRPDFVWHHLAGHIGDALERTTIGALCQQATRDELPRESDDPPMYFI